MLQCATQCTMWRLETTVEFLSFGCQKTFRNQPNLHTKRTNRRVFRRKDACGITKSEDPDQTAPLGTVCPKTWDHYSKLGLCELLHVTTSGNLV